MKLKLTLLLLLSTTFLFAQNLIINGDFEDGATSWQRPNTPPSNNWFKIGNSTLNQCDPHSGIKYCWYGDATQAYVTPPLGNASNMYQEFTVPANAIDCELDYYYMVATQEPIGAPDNDILVVSLKNTSDSTLHEFEIITNNQTNVLRNTTVPIPLCRTMWEHSVFNVPTQFFGQPVRLYFTANPTIANIEGTMFRLDDIQVIPNTVNSVESISNKGIKIYPNPSTGMVYVDSHKENFEYKIKSLTGQLWSMGSIHNNIINISDLPIGVYSLELLGNELHTFKIIKK